MGNGENHPVLVYGATGMQGGFVLRELLKSGVPVRALVRDAEKAQPLADLGATLAIGNFDDEASLAAASEGVRAIFSMQNAPLVDRDSERREARAVLGAAKAAGVPQIIHTSVSGASNYRTMPEWGTGRWDENYWESKAEVQDAVRDAGFRYHTIVQPSMLMENFTRPKSDFLYPDLIDDAFITVLEPDTKMAVIAGSDLGRTVAAAVLDPERFNGAAIGLAGERLTMGEIAGVLSDATGRSIVARTVTPDEALARGQYPPWVTYQQWLVASGYPAMPAELEAFGIQPLTLAAWAREHKEDISRRD